MKRARGRIVLALAIFASWAQPAEADSANRVVLLTIESEQDLTALELLARLRGELHAAELEVIVEPVATDADLRVAVEASPSEAEPAAVIAVRYLRAAPPNPAGAEVWISDRLTSTTLMQVVRLSSPQVNPAPRLAVQVAEVLKARLALLWVKPAPLPPPTPLPPADPEPPTAEAPSSRLLLGLGLGVAHHARGNVWSWFPSLRAGYEPPSNGWSTASIQVVGTWTPDETTFENGAGAAHIRQALVSAQASLRFLPHSPVQPLISAGVGAFHVRVRGESSAPYAATTASTWSAATTLGTGLWVQPSSDIAWLLEAQALTALSPTEVRIGPDKLATLGLPAFILGTSVIGRY